MMMILLQHICKTTSSIYLVKFIRNHLYTTITYDNLEINYPLFLYLIKTVVKNLVYSCTRIYFLNNFA